MNENIERIRYAFRGRFGSRPDFIGCAPGRVNLIGEHTDYTGGLALPVAIDKEILFAVKAASGDSIRGYSLDFDEAVDFRSGEYDPLHACHWLRYVLGVLREVSREGAAMGGFDFCVLGTVPMGSGLSSSAALELATLTAVAPLFGLAMGKKAAALLCQRAERDFVGVNCGIMDQYISSSAVRDHALKIDCRDFSSEAIKVETPGHTWLVMDSRKRRGLVDSEYNLRRSQCQAGLGFLQSAFPSRDVANLRDVTLQELGAFEGRADAVLFKRIRHVISENDRVLCTCAALEEGDVKTVGALLNASHASLRDDFEVSCPELDGLVEIACGPDGVAGARLTGAGFGGCAIALVRDDAVAGVTAALLAQYPERFPDQKEPVRVWPIRFMDGARLIASETKIAQTAG